MPNESEESYATQKLNEHPDWRQEMSESEEFQKLKDSHKSVVVDGTRFYVVGGDMLWDEDELYFYNFRADSAQ